MTQQETSPLQIWAHPIHFLSFGFGSGLLPKMPGTYGSIVGLLLYIPAYYWLSTIALIGLTVVGFIIGIYFCQATTDVLHVEDHPAIVWDEIVGMWVALIAIPPVWWLWGIAFILFRFFDILKPPPIAQVDRYCSGGLGIMLDDLLAGFVSLLLIQLIAYLMLAF